MVSVVPSIIPILTANAVAANQPKKQKKTDSSGEKKLKDSPLNDKVNCRVYLNNGKTIEGHFNGYWYEDNSDEEGIWIKTDNGILTINSDEYNRVQYYHKKSVKESSFNEEINSILKNAGCSLVESQNYFTDWKNIKDKVVKMVIRGRLEESGYLENDEWFIQQWLEENASPEMLEQLYEECGTDDLYWVAVYINKNADEGGVISKVAYEVIGQYYDTITEQLQKEFEDNNLIYRMIDSDKSPKEIAQILKTNGTGNCWAKQEENAKAYYGNGNYNEYCLIGEATMDNVNWETTIYLRMMAEYENEVRLKKDTPIHIVGIKYYHYNEDNKLDKQDHMKVDLDLNVGHSYVFEESKQPLKETVKRVNKEFADTRLVTSASELNRILNNNNETRVVYDKVKKWFLVGDSENSIHTELINDALIDGYYEPFEYKGQMITGQEPNNKGGDLFYELNPRRFVLFRTSSDSLNGEEYYYDRYQNCYIYDEYCVFDRKGDFVETPLYKLLGEPKDIENLGDIDENIDGIKLMDADDELDESIAYASKKDLSDIILKNPTKRELRENNLTLCRCIEDSEGNWYFTDMENMLHAYIVSELRDEASFPLFDGNDCYGIAYYDAESNEFWFNLNDYMYKKECIEQYNNSEYLRTTFPNARVIPNPWNNQMYDELYDDDDDEEEQLDESVKPIELDHLPPIYEAHSINEVKRLLRRFRFGAKGIYNISTGHLFLCDNEMLIHHNLAKVINTNIEPVDTYSKFSFYNSIEKALDSEYVYEDVWGYGWGLYTDGEIYVWVCYHDLDGQAFDLLTRNMEEIEPQEDEDGYLVTDQLNEEVAYTGALIGDTILKNPTRKELREWDLMNCRVVLDWNTNDFYFADAYINIHDDIIGKVNAGENDSLYYDCYDNTFYKRDEYRNENEKMYMERSLSQWLSSFEYITNTFGNFNAKICMEEEPFE